MSAKWEKQEGNEGVLTIEVPAEDFDKALDQAFKKVVKTVQIPGFRKGKVPRNIFEKRFGVESLYQDRSEEHTSELQSRGHLVCRLLLDKKKNKIISERA